MVPKSSQTGHFLNLEASYKKRGLRNPELVSSRAKKKVLPFLFLKGGAGFFFTQNTAPSGSTAKTIISSSHSLTPEGRRERREVTHHEVAVAAVVLVGVARGRRVGGPRVGASGAGGALLRVLLRRLQDVHHRAARQGLGEAGKHR